MFETWRKRTDPGPDPAGGTPPSASHSEASSDALHDTSRVVPIILAAGASTRMGGPKALCDFYGRSCLQLALDACVEARLGRPIVVLGFWASQISTRVRLDAATVRINDLSHRGQTSSLKVGLRALPSDAEAFLLYPVDFPLLTAMDIQPLLVAWRERRTGQRIFIPSYARRRGHPVLFDAELRAAFLGAHDDAPARAVIEALPDAVSHVEHDTPYVLMDMDTPQDYSRCLAEFRGRAMRPTGEASAA